MCIYAPLECLVPQKPEEDIRFPGTGVTGGFEPPCWCWELNLGTLKEQPVLLIL